jgi:Rieske Fe-S protein
MARQTENIRRRTFLKHTGSAIALGAVSLSFLDSCESYIKKDDSTGTAVKIYIDNEDKAVQKNLNRIGYGVLKYFGLLNYGIPVIIVRINDNEFVSFSAMCTHAHCIMHTPLTELPAGVQEGYRLIKCSCHGSKFDPYNNGAVVKGPAEQPLKQFTTEFDPDNRIITIIL